MNKAEQFQLSSTSEDGFLNQVALGYILDAWQEALHDGLEPETLANAALYAALTDLISTYGEDAVAQMAAGLSRRIHHGEFTVNRTTQ